VWKTVGRGKLHAKLQRMLIYNPTERISAKQMLKHQFFNDLDKSQLPAGAYDGTLMLSDEN
jgi:serine/threonine protein kinase